MRLNRRSFLAGSAFVALGPQTMAQKRSDFESLRSDFPWAVSQTYLNSASCHPLSVHSEQAMQSYMAYKTRGPAEGRRNVADEQFSEVKVLFARLINAKQTEVALVQSTLAGENLVLHGLGIPGSVGNVVTDELHYSGALYIYKMLGRSGVDVRVVKQRDWRIDVRDLERAVDRKTKLVSMALVSNINGFLHDARAVSELAHAHGAYLYADIIQAAGCVPVDVRAMGIDFAASGTHKWLMGERGLGFLYVREDLQGSVLKPTHFGFRQFTNFRYHTFPNSPPGPDDFTWEPRPGAACYEVGNISNIAVACQQEALRYILNLGVENIAAHVRPLVARLRKELPALGYPCISPPESPAPIATFLIRAPEQIPARLAKANVVVTVSRWNQMRVSPSVFNNDQDVDRLLTALT